MPKQEYKSVTIVGFSKTKHTVDPRENENLYERDKANPVSVIDTTNGGVQSATVPIEAKEGDNVQLRMVVKTTTYNWNRVGERWVTDSSGKQLLTFRYCGAKMLTDTTVKLTHVSNKRL